MWNKGSIDYNRREHRLRDAQKEYKKARRNKVLAQIAGLTMVGFGVGGAACGVYIAEVQHQERLAQPNKPIGEYGESLARRDEASQNAVAFGVLAAIGGACLWRYGDSQQDRQDTAAYHINYLERF